MLAKLIDRARRGDEEAMTQLLDRFRPLVLATARRFFREGLEWDDLVQEGNLSLVEAIFRFNPRGRAGFPWYAKRRVYYALYSYCRRAARRKKGEGTSLDRHCKEEGFSLLELLSAAEPGPEEVTLRGEEDRQVARALAQLAEKQRLVVRALHLEGLGVSQVAAELGVTPAAVKGLEKRGLKNLHRLLGDSPPCP